MLLRSPSVFVWVCDEWQAPRPVHHHQSSASVKGWQVACRGGMRTDPHSLQASRAIHDDAPPPQIRSSPSLATGKLSKSATGRPLNANGLLSFI